MEFQAIAWEGSDLEGRFTVRVYGRGQDRKSVSLATHFNPFFFIKVRENHSVAALRVALKAHFWELVSANEQRSIDLWGFQNGHKSRFVRVEFKTHRAMRNCVWSLEKIKEKDQKWDDLASFGQLKLYEANIDPVLRFMHLTNITSTGWINPGAHCEPDFNAHCDINLFCSNWTTLRPVARDDIAPIKIASFDIECYSPSGDFPSPTKPGDVCFQIGITSRTFGTDDPWVKKCLCLKQTDGPDNESFGTERELLERFASYIKELDPDLLTGWNIFGFDLEYLQMRTVLCGCSAAAQVWGRLKDEPIKLVTKNLSSNALGNNMLKMVPMNGRYIFDLFQEVKREHKLESYSLNNVSKHFLADQKNDMPVKEIFKRFLDGDSRLLGEVADYCLKDTELPLKLMDKLCTIPNLFEMAKACWVPLSFLSERGQQIKVFSQMARKARELGFLIPTIRVDPKSLSDEKYEGATVLEAQTGAYYGPITALDFASLYPSIMCAHNLCYSTLVMNPVFDNLEGVTYEQFGSFRFAQAPAPSLLPAILNDLKAFRKKAKKLMAAAEGTPMEAVYNGQQLAYKISMNSIYGFTGASKGMLPLVAIASTVTMRGRQMIEETKNYVEANFPGAKVRYGDSVMPGTPVMIRRSGNVSIETIESLGNEWSEYPGFLKEGTGKEKAELNLIESWTHDGWQPIKRVIRHKCSKKIYRILTHTGLVDVTEDHSLLSPDLDLLKSGEVNIGQQLFHRFPKQIDITSECSTEQAFIFGMFVGDGSCGIYDCPSGRKATWAINNRDLELLEKCKIYCENIHPEYTFTIMDTLNSSGVYKLSPRGGSVIDIANYYRKNCYDGQAKKVPIEAFGNPTAFLEGLWASDGCRKDNETSGCHRIDTKNQVTAQWYYILLRFMDFNVSLNTRSDKQNVYRLTWSTSTFRKDHIAVKKINILHESWDGYVYDLETCAGTFQAGIGQMIVKNTDSVMVEFDVQGRKGQEAIEYSWAQGSLAADQCTKLFKAPNDLELEKVYCPYFLYSKKRYAAKMWEGKTAADGTVQCHFKKIDVKGLQVVRRDSCQFVRDTLKSILELVLESDDPRPAIECARAAARILKGGSVPIDKLLMSKQLASGYKVKMPHVEVRDKIRARAPGSEPQQGDRVPFVIVESAKGAKMWQKAEDPVWVQETNAKIDYIYYFEHQLKKPVCDLLEPLVGANPAVMIFDPPKPGSRITDFFVKR
jgi:DNA polymerase delta subunit 1